MWPRDRGRENVRSGCDDERRLIVATALRGPGEISPEPDENVPERYTEGAARPNLIYKYEGRMKSLVYFCFFKRNE